MKSKPERLLVVVSPPGDLLASELADMTLPAQVSLRRVEPKALGCERVTMDGKHCRLNGSLVAGVIFRTQPAAGFAGDYAETDQPFADAELSAMWLAVLDLPSVWAVNRYDAEMWYDGMRWPVWQRRFQQAGIPTSCVAVGGMAASGPGNQWMPYGGGELQDGFDPETHAVLASSFTCATAMRRSLVACGQVIGPCHSTEAKWIASFLSDIGIRLAEITFDEQGQVLRLNVLPEFSNPNLASSVAGTLLKGFHDYLRCW